MQQQRARRSQIQRHQNRWAIELKSGGAERLKNMQQKSSKIRRLIKASRNEPLGSREGHQTFRENSLVLSDRRGVARCLRRNRLYHPEQIVGPMLYLVSQQNGP